MAIAKEQLQQIIAQNDINSMGDIYTLFKDSFKDMLQERLEAEMDSSNKQDVESENKRNGYSPKTVKSQYGEFQVDIPRDREGTFEPQIIPKYQRDIFCIEEKVISFTLGECPPEISMISL